MKYIFIKYLGDKGGIGMEFDCHVSYLLPECRSTRSLVGLGGDRCRDLTPVALTARVLTFDTELIFKALDQACDLIAGFHKLLRGY